MKKITHLLVYIFIIQSDCCMEQSQEGIYDRNYEDACGILQGTSKRGLIDPEKILEITAALVDIRKVFPEKSFTKLRSSHHFDRVLLLAENEENQTQALEILKLFPIAREQHENKYSVVYFKPDVDVIYLKNLLKACKFKAELDYFDRKMITVEMIKKNEWSFYFKERLDFGCGTKKYCISYDPAQQKITSYKRLKKCKD